MDSDFLYDRKPTPKIITFIVMMGAAMAPVSQGSTATVYHGCWLNSEFEYIAGNTAPDNKVRITPRDAASTSFDMMSTFDSGFVSCSLGDFLPFFANRYFLEKDRLYPHL